MDDNICSGKKRKRFLLVLPRRRRRRRRWFLCLVLVLPLLHLPCARATFSRRSRATPRVLRQYRRLQTRLTLPKWRVIRSTGRSTRLSRESHEQTGLAAHLGSIQIQTRIEQHSSSSSSIRQHRCIIIVSRRRRRGEFGGGGVLRRRG